MKRNICTSIAGLSSVALVTGLLLAGCSTPPSNGASATAPASAAKTPMPNQSGATLWAQNCGHCHNIRSPSNYSPAQWEVVMMHMRVRANLTPEEHKKILEFLKSGT